MKLDMITYKHLDTSLSILLHNIPLTHPAIRSFVLSSGRECLNPYLSHASEVLRPWGILVNLFSTLSLEVQPEMLSSWPRRSAAKKKPDSSLRFRHLVRKGKKKQACQTLLPNMYAHYITIQTVLGADLRDIKSIFIQHPPEKMANHILSFSACSSPEKYSFNESSSVLSQVYG